MQNEDIKVSSIIYESTDFDGSPPTALGSPGRLVTTEPRPDGRLALTGAHSRELLAELGYETAEIDEMVTAGVVGCSDSEPSPVLETTSRWRISV